LKLSVIIPTYNECGTIEEVVRAVLAVERADEIIIVDDGSTDGTRDLYAKVAALDECIQVILHERNMGKGAALRTGFSKATGDIFLIQDADM
jgi:glycosyltransferase involved in cell wall biosynthesis